ncbi:MAG: type II secretion system protein GspG [Armatimonadota bacterium]
MTAPEDYEQAETRRIWGCYIIVLLLLLLLAVAMLTPQPHPHRKAKESTLKANLHQIRNAIDAFKADTGVYPANLIDLTAADASNVKAKIKPVSYKGPYLSVSGGIGTTHIPVNPFKDPSDADYPSLLTHWVYDAKEGIVRPAIPKEGTTVDGIPYSEL